MIKIECRSKINLYLEIQNKRKDGYHNIGTLFQALEFGDQLEARVHDTISLQGGDNLTKNLEDNLIFKAAKKVQDHFKIKKGIHFSLNKLVPTGAGLGGGSADAAGAIKLCNQIWDLNLPLSEFQGIAQSLGADVPFFLDQGTRFAEGIGEKLTPASAPPDFQILVATPNCEVPTQAAYELIDNYRNEFSNFSLEYEKNHQNQQFFSSLSNDFEGPILEAYPEIKVLKQAISRFNPVKVMLSGSGSSLFALFAQKSASVKCFEALENRCNFRILTKFLSSA